MYAEPSETASEILQLSSSTAKDKSEVGTTDDEIQDSVMNVYHTFPTILLLLLVKLRIQLRDLSELRSYREDENKAVLLSSHLLIVASLLIVCTCKKMAT